MSSVRTTVNHFLIRWWHATKSGFYTTTGDDQLSGWTQKLQSTSQSQTCTEKRSWSLTVGLLSIRSTIASESQRNHYIWEVCSANWWDAPRLAMPAASICQRHPTPVLLPGKSRGWKSLVGCSPWGLEELDTTERLHFHFSLSCIGEGNGNPLQYSCWRIPGTVEPGRLLSMGSHRVGHDWCDLAAAAAYTF